MGKIVAIGGGSTGNHGSAYETGIFDREIVALTGKPSPAFLFIGLANGHPDTYYEAMCAVFRDRLGCTADNLSAVDIKDRSVAQAKIRNADIIYVGGGNTFKLMKMLRRYGTDEFLAGAYESGKVMCGISAGAICWCSWGNSNSGKRSEGGSAALRVRGLGFADILFCPHYGNADRKTSLKAMMKRTSRIPAVALDYAALEIVDGRFRVLSCDILPGEESVRQPVAAKCRWRRGQYIEEFPDWSNFTPIDELLKK